MNLLKRKRNRLRYYDYSKPGAYFITVCTAGRCCILSHPFTPVGAVTDRPETEFALSPYGEIVNEAIAGTSAHYENATVDSYVIMPNHIHMILVLYPHCGRPVTAPTVSDIVNQMKAYVSGRIGCSIWQKSFHDHIIRNRDDHRMIARYIHDNPKTWQTDCFYPSLQKGHTL